jgi:regulator of nucleoside diphosphate kinase
MRASPFVHSRDLWRSARKHKASCGAFAAGYSNHFGKRGAKGAILSNGPKGNSGRTLPREEESSTRHSHRRSALKSTTALLTRADQDRLRRFISVHEARLAREEEALALLSSRVESAQIVDPRDVPGDLVTMHSQLRVRDPDTGRSHVITVTLPMEHGSDSFQRAFTIAAVLGARAGDDMVWRYTGGIRRACIQEVFFQPESRRVWSRAHPRCEGLANVRITLPETPRVRAQSSLRRQDS